MHKVVSRRHRHTNGGRRSPPERVGNPGHHRLPRCGRRARRARQRPRNCDRQTGIPQGCITGHEGRLIRVGAFPIDVVDTTGAGDSFVAGFLHSWLRHQGDGRLPALRHGVRRVIDKGSRRHRIPADESRSGKLYLCADQELIFTPRPSPLGSGFWEIPTVQSKAYNADFCFFLVIFIDITASSP